MRRAAEVCSVYSSIARLRVKRDLLSVKRDVTKEAYYVSKETNYVCSVYSSIARLHFFVDTWMRCHVHMCAR